MKCISHQGVTSFYDCSLVEAYLLSLGFSMGANTSKNLVKHLDTEV